MSFNGSDSATGSGQQQSEKRKFSPSKDCNAAGSLTSVIENIGPVAKKKFEPTIPPTRSKQKFDTPLPLKERKPVKPYRGISDRKNRGRGTHGRNYTRGGGHQEHHSGHNRPATPKLPPNRPVAKAPLEKPTLIQMEGSLFGQGVGVESSVTERKRGPNKSIQTNTFDPVMHALDAVDKYEELRNNNFSSEIVSSSQEVKEESHHQMKKFVLKRGSRIKNEDQLTVNQNMFDKLKYHQIEGIQFMWDACFKISSTAGCVLAHCMGLGKSLQVVTLSHTVLMNAICEVNRVMVVCPLSTVFNWENEFKIWLPGDTFATLNVCELASAKTNEARVKKITKWLNFGGVLIIGYEMFRTLTKEKKKPSEQDLLFIRALVNPGPDLLVCDEGHLLKNEDSEIYKAMNQICTRRRIMLTGTPLQNNLFEFFTMVQFVNPGLLGTKGEFGKNFVKILEKGQTVDSTQLDVRAMKRRALILHKMLESTVQRFDSNVLSPFLPPKFEYVVSVKLSELQIKLYTYYLENLTKSGSVQPLESRVESAGLFSDYQQLSRVSTHPKALLLASCRRNTITKNRPDVTKKGKNTKNDEEDISWVKEPDVETEDPAASNCWWSDLISENEIHKMEHSGKLLILMEILGHCQSIGDKLLVFSQSLTSLDLIEEFLAIENFKNQAKSADNSSENSGGSWIINTDYFRLDGSTSSEQRLKWCSSFNDPKNSRSRLFLISTRAGGIGINLIGANRAIIFDASWNPSQDLQSVFRVYRLGQKKSCYVYRFVAQGTMEEKVYYRQVAKLSLSRRIVDEEQMDRTFASNDLKDLYTFNADGQIQLTDSELVPENCLHPNDELLSGLAVRMKEWVGGFREHDSLLQNRPEEFLENAEREAIWKIFQETKDITQVKI